MQYHGCEGTSPDRKAWSPSDWPDPARLERAIGKLKSLRDGDQGLVDVIACGRPAIPALRALLFEREPGGLFQTRCHAVEALAALKAYDVLVEFLEAAREAADPVERIGDEVVTNAAARALAGSREPHVFELLVWLAQAGPLPGVLAALGASGRVEAIPYLVEALAEDENRLAAEAVLRNYGSLAHQALAVAACQSSPPLERESESRLRQRRSALALLAETGVQPDLWPILRNLMQHQDPKIAALACKICFMCAPESEKRDAVLRLIGLLPGAGFVLEQEIERCLALYFGTAEE
jgi:HEAT repeat protein